MLAWPAREICELLIKLLKNNALTSRLNKDGKDPGKAIVVEPESYVCRTLTWIRFPNKKRCNIAPFRAGYFTRRERD